MARSRAALGLGVALTAFVAGQAGAIDQATGFDMATKPLVTVIAVKPNIMIALDDSGSMSFELSMDGTNDGSLWYNRAADSYVRSDGTFFDNTDDSGRKTSYLFPWTEGPGRNGHYTVPPFIQYAFARSPDYNRAYYDPAVTYEPWPDVGSKIYNDVPITAAPYHIEDDGGNDGRLLNLDGRATGCRAGAPTPCIYNDNNDEDFRIEFMEGMIVPAGTRLSDDTNYVAPADCEWLACRSGNSDVERDAIEWNPAVVYVATDNGSYAVDGSTPSISCAAPHVPGDYKIFEFNPSNFRGTGNIVALGPDGRCLERQDRDSGLDLQNFANWFTYYRKRHLATRNGLVASLGEIRIPLRSGYFTINNRNNVTMREFEADPTDPADERVTLLTQILEEDFGGGTPNRPALHHAGQQFENRDIIQQSCQKNFVMFFTDGFAQTETISGINNEDAESGVFPGFTQLNVSGVDPYTDDNSGGFADIAMRYYRDFNAPAGFDEGLVPIPGVCNDATATVVNADCNANLHMNTYVVTLNAQGEYYNNTVDGFSWETVADAYVQAPDWPAINAVRDRRQIDDLYHGAVNGRGLMLNARTPQALRERFQEALADIAAKSRSASALAATSTRISTDSRLYQSIYDTETWSGDLRAIDLNGAEVWLASSTVPAGAAAVNRNALTWTGTGGVVDLDWDILSTDQRADFVQRAEAEIGSSTLLSAFGDLATAGDALVDYVAGIAVNEMRNGGVLRDRGFIDLDGNFVETPLGDIVNSVPLVMGPSNEGWTRLGGAAGEAYRDFVDVTKQARPLALFVGANAGALQAFDAENGAELWAYFPKMLITKTAALPDPDYDHEFYVDGTPVIADAFNGSWRSVLVVGLGLGGRGYVALDVTAPATPSVLWEFRADPTQDFSGPEVSDPDLGFAIGEAVITRAPGGTWVAVLANGFGSEGNDGYLYVLDLFSGNVLKKLAVGTGTATDPAGLASPRVLMNQDDGLTTESLYVGDLQGRVYRVDASSAPSGWTVDNGGQPIFRAEADDGDAQPITSAPTLVRTPEGEVIVYVGTGQFFENPDKVVSPSETIQTFYAVFDPQTDSGTILRSDLTEIPLGATATVEGDLVRSLSEVAFDETADGWFIDLFVDGEGRGERVVAAPRVRFGRLLFTTFQPIDDVCKPGGIPRLYVLDARTGAPRLLAQVEVSDTGGGPDGTQPIFESAGSVELEAGAPVVPPIAIDTTEGANQTEGAGLLCPFGRPVFAIDPNNPLDRILLGCLQEGRVNWGERFYAD